LPGIIEKLRNLFLDNHPCPVFLDEIQFAPEVVGGLKRRVDQRREKPGQYVLSGSQQWEVMRLLAESLAGRAVFLDSDRPGSWGGTSQLE